jgi:hypothetical protein
MSGKVIPQPGEIWESIFDNRRATILKIKYSPDWECNCVKYVKDGNNRELLKPVQLFLSTYQKLI